MKRTIACVALLAALSACSKKEPEAAAPAAPPAAEASAPAAAPLSQGNAAERYVGGLQSSVEKAKSAQEKANAAIQRSAPSDPAAGE